jgi:hypothetical protein
LEENLEDHLPNLFVNRRDQVSIIQESMFRQDLSDALAASFFVKDLEGPVQLFHGDPFVFDEQLADFLLARTG